MNNQNSYCLRIIAVFLIFKMKKVGYTTCTKYKGAKKVMNKEKKLSKKLSTDKMHLKRGKIKLYTKLSTLSTFLV